LGSAASPDFELAWPRRLTVNCSRNKAKNTMPCTATRQFLQSLGKIDEVVAKIFQVSK